jgi:hypothetical protein
MPKAYLKFELPQETDEFELAQNGGKYKAALDDFDNWLRAMDKYENKRSVTVKDAREKLRELMHE